MNYLVYLDTRAGELEKILSGVKTMLMNTKLSIQNVQKERPMFD